MVNRMRKSLLILILIMANTHFSQPLHSKINNYVSTYVNTADFSGTILITQEDSIIYSNSFGFANKSFNVENDIHTKFMIGSISKQFTAVGILKLEKDGKLNTEDLLSTYFPSWNDAENITIHQLLTHTSGITDIFNLHDFSLLSCQNISLDSLVRLIQKEELLFEPGQSYQYSNGGYAILAKIIEIASNSTFDSFMTENILEPLELYSTGHRGSSEIIQSLAVGYDPLGYDKLVLTDYVDNELLKGSGSLYSNVYDIMKWIEMLKRKSFLDEESYQKLFDNYGNNYGYGISIYNSFGRTVFGHDGRINGFIADYLHYAEDDITIIILGNIQTGVADFFRRDLAAIIFGKDFKSRAKTIPPSTDSPEWTNDVYGSYSFGPNFIVTVKNIDGLIKAKANQGSYSELVLLDNGKFFSRTLYSYIEFVKDSNGKIKKMIWTNNEGNRFEGSKID